MSDGTGAQPARVWLRVGSQLRPAATWPIEQATSDPSTTIDADAVSALPDADLAVPVREQDELLGVLTIAKPRGERVTEVDVDLVERLAAASGVLLRNLRLDAELAQRLDEIEASRRRLVSAQDDARRRIEAELGGGTRAQLRMLGDRLMGLQRDVDAAATPKTAVLLGQLVTSTDTALDTLAGLAAGVYPPQLAAEARGRAVRTGRPRGGSGGGAGDRNRQVSSRRRGSCVLRCARGASERREIRRRHGSPSPADRRAGSVDLRGRRRRCRFRHGRGEPGHRSARHRRPARHRRRHRHDHLPPRRRHHRRGQHPGHRVGGSR